MTIVGFNVYLVPPSGVEADKIKLTPEPIPTADYTYTGGDDNTEYDLRMTAIDDAGLESPLSDPISPLPKTNAYVVGDELSPADKATISTIVLASMSESGQPGVVFATDGPRGQWMMAWGNTAASGGRALTTNDHFRICSTSKLFTALAFMRAVAAGLITLDTTLEEAIPGIGIPYSDQITMRHLLTMRSGVQNYVSMPAVILNLTLRPTGPWDESKTLFYIKAGKPAFTPGSAYQYNNGNFVLIGLVLKALTGRYIRNIIMEDIVGPLGLTETDWQVNSLGKGVSAVTAPAGGTTQWNPDFLGAAGGITSTAADLIKFMQALRDHTILDETVWAHWTDTESEDSEFYGYPVSFSEGTPEKFGYGAGLESTARCLGHNGSWFGFDGNSCWDTETGACMVVLENKQTSSPVVLAAYTVITRRAMEALYPGSMTTQPNYKPHAAPPPSGAFPYTLPLTLA